MLLTPSLQAQPATRPSPAPVATILGIQGKVMVQLGPNRPWQAAQTNQVLVADDLLYTEADSRALIGFPDGVTIPIGPKTRISLDTPTGQKRSVSLWKGLLYFFHRGESDKSAVRTPGMSALIRGTEFAVEVAEDGTTKLSLFDGEVTVSNALGRIELRGGEQAEAAPNQPPRRTALLEMTSIIQWCLYYPAVLNLDDLGLMTEPTAALSESLKAYRAGDLLAALAAYPSQRQPTSDNERVFLAALKLSVGEVSGAEELLSPISAASEPVDAVRQLIATVKGGRFAIDDLRLTNGASALLAASYQHQSQGELEKALRAAKTATERAPGFSFAWARVAELEFGFGHTRAAHDAVEKSLRLAPRNAQALALRGFLQAARHRLDDALASFEQALAIDSALGNAWLGRGLCRIRRGDAAGGRDDLQVAATLEPQRALLRSYLGKAFHHAGDSRRAAHELDLAKQLDPRDPTGWLYSALVRQSENRINDGIRDLEHSQELNANRRVYRSRLLLDQDQAVRGANLATLYGDAGMIDISAREAARAVGLDYANYSAHLFLADSYNALRDPNQINLRHETPWFSEYLVANLLAPAQVGTLSPFVTQQDYARLFEQNRFGLSAAIEYLGRGAWTESAAQYGLHDRFSYAAEVFHRTDNGQHPNGDIEQLSATLRLKFEITPRDKLFLQGTYYTAEAGDVTPRYDPADANRGLRVEEDQAPILLAGYHHQWTPGVDTLFLGGWVRGSFTVTNSAQPTLVLEKTNAAVTSVVHPVALGQSYRAEADILTAELQQIVQRPGHTLLLGGRVQGGEFDARNRPDPTAGALGRYAPAELFTPTQHVAADFERFTAYGYYHWQPVEPLTLIAGVSYDHLAYPENFRFAPLARGRRSVEQVSPKAGVIWSPWRTTSVRLAYSQSRGGVSYDQSFQLEPTQVAGFNQAFRSVIPEAVGDANAAPRFEGFGLALDQKFPTGTYLGVSAERLRSQVARTGGAFTDDSTNVFNFPPFVFPTSLRRRFDYEERSLTVALNQLVGREWSFGARYRLSHADLEDSYPELPADIPGSVGFAARRHRRALLRQFGLNTLYAHPAGFFGQLEALWLAQDNGGDDAALKDDDFWQFNVWAGYRFARRRAEVRLGVLNLTDRDYRLNPLNLTAELPRERTFYASLRFNF